ncbi:unnamed protein product [Rhizophagus irregularis]|nr:unnamed protein product [Rhizophagus irregularis]
MSEKEVEPQNNTLTIEVSNEISSETKEEQIEKHRKSIDRIYVEEYSDDYVVTYSEKDKSVLGWTVNVEKNGYQPDVYFKSDQIKKGFNGRILNKKLLLFNDDWFIDLNSDRTNRDRFLELKHPISRYEDDHIGFLPNGDLVHVSLSGGKIYKYYLKDKPKNANLWEYSQINDIVIPESLYDQITKLSCSVYQTKLFLIVKIVNDNKALILQFDLLTMNLERQYITDITIGSYRNIRVIMNKNQTLLATTYDSNYFLHIYSMENGMLLFKNKYGDPIEFITLKNNSERLIVSGFDSNPKLVDPYKAYDVVDLPEDFNYTRKVFIDNGNVCFRNGLDENKLNKLQRPSNKINSIYTFSTFKIIQGMLNEIIGQGDIISLTQSSEQTVLKDKVEIKDSGLCKLVLSVGYDDYDMIALEDNDDSTVDSYLIPYILSFKLLNDHDLVLIHVNGIDIYTIDEDGLRNRYFWNNNKWEYNYQKYREDCYDYDINFTNEHYKPLIESILKDEFDDSKYSIPFSKFVAHGNREEIIKAAIYDQLASSNFRFEMLKMAIEDYDDVIRQITINENSVLVISKFGIEILKISIEKNRDNIIQQIFTNDSLVFVISKFGIEILKLAIEKNCDYFIQQIINRTIKDYNENYMTAISLNLPELCDYYPDYIIKYISSTSIMLSPYCRSIRNSKNTSLHSYTNIYIKESHTMASTLEQNSIPDFYFNLLFIISIIFGSILLIFEVRYYLWNYKLYLSDIWNLFVLGYAQAFFIVLRQFSNDPNSGPNTNMFNWFPTSLLAVYRLLTGDSGSLSSFDYPIGDYNKEEEFLLQKAKIIMEIELFYMLPYQRRNKKWFPDWIYYDIPVTEIRKLINAIDNNQTVFNYPPIISEKLRKLVVLTDDDNKLEKKIDQLTRQNAELKQQNKRIMKFIGVEQDNKEEKDSKKEQNSEKKQDSEEEQDNKLIEQTKEELTLKEKMDKIEQKMEIIMELLSKLN